MLRNLVKKFKSQSLGEGEEGAEPVCKSPRRTSSTTGTAASKESTAERDSGTESDEDELEQIETISTLSVAAVSQTSDFYESQASLNSAPPSHSDHDTNSRDSMGCESGIGLRESDSDTPTTTELLYQQNSEHSRLKQQLPARSSMARRLGGAFKPVPRRQASLPDSESPSDPTLRDRASSSAGEKRKWSQVQHKTAPTIDCSGNNETGGSGLLAARRTPVKLLIPPPGLVPLPSSDESGSEPGVPSNRVSPRKKCRQDKGDELELSYLSLDGESSGRPSLDFEKMREKMMKPGSGRKKHEGFCSSKAKLRGWGRGMCSSLSADCVQPDCVFRPVELPPDQAKTPTGDSSGFSQV